MSCRTDALCHSGGRIARHERQPAHSRERKEKCEALRMWRQHKKEHLEKRQFDSSALTVQTGAPTARSEDRLFLVEKKAVQATDEAQGAETKRRGGPGRRRELLQEATTCYCSSSSSN